MRIFIPNQRLREKVINHLEIAFDTEDVDDLRAAAKLVPDYYRITCPINARFRRKLWKRTHAGLTFEDGAVYMLHPATWKAEGRPRKTWVHTALHEFGHVVLWADGETKADLFADRWYGQKVRR